MQCPTPEPTPVKHRRCKDATVHRCRANDSARLDQRSMSRPSESGSSKKSPQQPKNGSRRLQSIRSGGGSERPPSSEKGGELLTLVPVQKRPRVEPADIPSRVSSRTNKPGRIDRELTHQKRINRKQTAAEPNSNRSMQRTHSSKHQSSRSVKLVRDQTAQILLKNGQLAESKTRVAPNKHVEPSQSKAKKISSSSKQSIQSISNSLPQRSRSRHLSLRSPIVQKNDRPAENKSRANQPSKLPRPNGSRARRYSSSSTASTTRSKSILNWSTRPNLLTSRKQSRAKTGGRRKASPPASPIPRHVVVSRWKPPLHWPARTRMEPKSEVEHEQGRFKKLANKLAIIFHHHHHHHHHHHLHTGEDDENGEGGHKDHERSLWKYLKGVLHFRKGRGEMQGKLHRHNFRVLMQWFFRHLWWMRQRRRQKVERLRPAKKVKWWEWFRRKGRMMVRGRRRIRLRLGFNGSHRRAAVGKR